MTPVLQPITIKATPTALDFMLIELWDAGKHHAHELVNQMRNNAPAGALVVTDITITADLLGDLYYFSEMNRGGFADEPNGGRTPSLAKAMQSLRAALVAQGYELNSSWYSPEVSFDGQCVSQVTDGWIKDN